MQYVLKSENRRACTLIRQTLLQRRIHAEIEPLID
jgi:hypothetical protein